MKLLKLYNGGFGWIYGSDLVTILLWEVNLLYIFGTKSIFCAWDDLNFDDMLEILKF